MIQKKFLSRIKLYQGILLGIALAIGFTVFAFTEPSQNPPSGNVAAPINISGTAQTKAGDLIVNRIFAKNISVAPGTSEYDITNVNSVTGYNDLFLKGNSDETDNVYIAGSNIRFYTNGTEKLTVSNNGNVGIGTVSPSQKLDVAGQINTSGGICIAGDCKTSWSQVGGVSHWGGYYRESRSWPLGNPQPPFSCSKTNPVTGSCNCPFGYLIDTYSSSSFCGGDFNCSETRELLCYKQ